MKKNSNNKNQSYSDELRSSDINSKGYGIISQKVMRDPRIPIQAKGIYGYICSFAGAGTTAFPSKETILQELHLSEQAYYDNRDYLVAYGYLTIEQEIRPDGTKGKNIFTIVTKPNINEIVLAQIEKKRLKRKEKNDKQREKNRPDTDYQSADNPSPDNPSLDNRGTKINKSKRINNNNYQSVSNISNIERLTEFEKYTLDRIINNCELHVYKPEQANAIKMAIETLFINDEFAKNKLKTSLSIVRGNLLYLNSEILTYAIDKIKKSSMNGTQIKSPTNYLAVCIYNAISEFYIGLMTDSELLKIEENRRLEIISEWEKELESKRGAGSQEEIPLYSSEQSSEQSDEDNSFNNKALEKEPGEDIFKNSIIGTELESLYDDIVNCVGAIQYNELLSKTELMEIKDNTIYLNTKDKFIADIMEIRYIGKIKEMLIDKGSNIRNIQIMQN